MSFREKWRRFNTLRPRQNGHHFPNEIFKCIFLNENIWISIRISLKFVPWVPIDNKTSKKATIHYLNQWWPISLTHIYSASVSWGGLTVIGLAGSCPVLTLSSLQMREAHLIHYCESLENAFCLDVFSCDQAALWMVFSVRLSVCPSVTHTFLTMLPSSYHHEIFSMQRVKVIGQKSR